ncbi:MAG: ArsR family transcriptional regulator [Candidatus Woesearchaeota archaeon]
MGQSSKNLDKLMELFYENPEKNFTVRELAVRTKIPKSTVHNHLLQLNKEGLLEENKAAGSNIFKVKKTFFYITKIFESGLVDFITEKLQPSCIILFGSFRKGESDQDSDIDLFIESTKEELDLTGFEKKLKHKIQIFVEKDINDLPDRLFNNVINGIKLGGYFKIRK